MQKKYTLTPFAKTIGLSFLAHALVIGSALYFSLTSFKPKAADAADPYVNVVMVDLAAFAAPAPAEAVQSTPAPEIQPEPEPIAPPEVKKVPPIEPKPTLRPTKPKETIIKKRKQDKKPEKTPEHHRRKPLHHDDKPHQRPVDHKMAQRAHEAAAANAKPAVSTGNAASAAAQNAPARPAASGKPKPISRNAMMYPRQAQRMNVEDELVVKYDVNDQGQVENIRIIKAAYAKLFERDVVKTMKKWRYEKRAAKDLQVIIVFSLTQGTKIKG